MDDDHFVTYAPRRVERKEQPASHHEEAQALPAMEAKIEAHHDAATTTSNAETQVDEQPVSEPEVETDVAAPQFDPSVKDVLPRRCDHAIEIRNEAVRLAAIACGRALRHAVLLHPQVIAGFVDDALEAAGHPRTASIRVHPDSLAAIDSSRHNSIGDDRLGCGEVVVECEGMSLAADVDTRAELLASAGGA